MQDNRIQSIKERCDFYRTQTNTETVFVGQYTQDVMMLLDKLAVAIADRDAWQKDFNALKEAQRWIPVSERLPNTEQVVIAYMRSAYPVIACLAHVGYHELTTEDWRDYEGETEYDEENDCYWIKPCWYEVNVVDDNPNWQVDDDYEVTHWMPLHAAP